MCRFIFFRVGIFRMLLGPVVQRLLGPARAIVGAERTAEEMQ